MAASRLDIRLRPWGRRKDFSVMKLEWAAERLDLLNDRWRECDLSPEASDRDFEVADEGFCSSTIE